MKHINLHLKIPEATHKILKTYSVENGINLLPKAEELLIEAINKKLKKNGTIKKNS